VRATRGLTPFIGRDTEMEALARVMERVVAGNGEVVAVVADPGIGKSRLVHEFVRTIVPSGWSVLETSAASHDAKAPYRPVSGLLRSWFGVEEQDLKPQIERKVRTKVEDLYPELGPTLPALSSLLDLFGDGSGLVGARPPAAPAAHTRRCQGGARTREPEQTFGAAL
jgi:Predicted ATPase